VLLFYETAVSWIEGRGSRVMAEQQMLLTCQSVVWFTCWDI